MLFDKLEPLLLDPLLGLSVLYAADPSPDKADLGIGIYVDGSGIRAGQARPTGGLSERGWSMPSGAPY